MDNGKSIEYNEVFEMVELIANQEGENGYPEYEYAGNIGVMCDDTGEGLEEYREAQLFHCCGIYEDSITHKGKTYLVTFDFGH